MTSAESRPHSIFACVKGRRLSAVAGQVHEPVERTARSDKQPLNIWLTFDNRVTIGFGTRGDGHGRVEGGTPSKMRCT